MEAVIDVKWNGDMAFEASMLGHTIIMDLDRESGGNDLGPRPKPLMLAALGGCTGVDVIRILKKMKIKPAYFNMNIKADQTDEFPRRYYRIKIYYEFRGDNLPLNKIRQAIELSHNKYCGVSAVYKQSIDITYEIRILD
jgi:putative redox protein